MDEQIQKETDKCQKCGMPLENENDCCNCESYTCYHCCTCQPDCSCGCKNREGNGQENAKS